MSVSERARGSSGPGEPRRSNGLEARDDVSVHVRVDRAPREIEGVRNSPGVRTAVADDDGAVHAEEQRAAVLGVVDLLVQAGEDLGPHAAPFFSSSP